MPRPLRFLVLTALLLGLAACTCDSRQDTPPANAPATAQAPSTEAPAQDDIPEETRNACQIFEPPWGEGDWLAWAHDNPKEAERWLTEAPQRMPKADLATLPRCGHLSAVFLGFSTITDLTPLAGLPNLKILDLRFALNVTDLGPLRDALRLEELLIWGTGVSDLAPLGGLPHLKRLDARMTPVEDLTPLEEMSALEWIDLLQTKVSDLTSLAKLEHLTEIRLCNTQAGDLSPFYAAGERYLYLDLCNTPFRDFPALSRFPNLTSLKLTGLPIEDLEVLSSLTQLETLDLSNAAVSSLSPLIKLPNLKRLVLFGVEASREEVDALKTANPNLEIVGNEEPEAARR